VDKVVTVFWHHWFISSLVH